MKTAHPAGATRRDHRQPNLDGFVTIREERDLIEVSTTPDCRGRSLKSGLRLNGGDTIEILQQGQRKIDSNGRDGWHWSWVLLHRVFLKRWD